MKYHADAISIYSVRPTATAAGVVLKPRSHPRGLPSGSVEAGAEWATSSGIAAPTAQSDAQRQMSDPLCGVHVRPRFAPPARCQERQYRCRLTDLLMAEDAPGAGAASRRAVRRNLERQNTVLSESSGTSQRVFRHAG